MRWRSYVLPAHVCRRDGRTHRVLRWTRRHERKVYFMLWCSDDWREKQPRCPQLYVEPITCLACLGRCAVEVGLE